MSAIGTGGEKSRSVVIPHNKTWFDFEGGMRGEEKGRSDPTAAPASVEHL